MANMKRLSVLIILSLATTAPAFAQDPNPTHRGRAQGAHNELIAPLHVSSRTQKGFTINGSRLAEKDLSRVGAEDADLNPSAN